MIVFFDDKKDFYEDLNELVARLDKYDHPLVVVPLDKDARQCTKEYGKDENFRHITFISYDYWLSKKWLSENYDHIDFFRADQFFIRKSYDVQVGCMTVRRTMKKKEEN